MYTVPYGVGIPIVRSRTVLYSCIAAPAPQEYCIAPRIASAGSVNVEVIITIPIVAADEENTAADDTAANDAAADGTAAGSVLPSRTASLTKAVTQLVALEHRKGKQP